MVTTVSSTVWSFAAEHPVYYLAIDFCIAMTVGVFFLFLQDIENWIAAIQAAARQAQEEKAKASKGNGYEPLEEDVEAGEGRGPAIVEFDVAPEVKSLEELNRELRYVADKVEELEIKVRVHRRSTTDAAVAMRSDLERLRTRQAELQRRTC